MAPFIYKWMLENYFLKSKEIVLTLINNLAQNHPQPIEKKEAKSYQIQKWAPLISKI